MPSIKKMKETMVKLNISKKVIDQFDFSEQKGNRPEPIIAFIEKMDKLLTHDQCLLIIEKEGCCKGGKREKDCKEFGKKYAEKSIGEKLTLMAGIELMMVPKLNNDGTFSIKMSGYQNGIHTGKTTCSCGTIKKLKQPFSVSPTFCGCCAGHFLYHYQNALGVKLRLMKINSSPLNTNGEKPCEFTFEIIK